MIIASSIMIIL